MYLHYRVCPGPWCGQFFTAVSRHSRQKGVSSTLMQTPKLETQGVLWVLEYVEPSHDDVALFEIAKGRAVSKEQAYQHAEETLAAELAVWLEKGQDRIQEGLKNWPDTTLEEVIRIQDDWTGFLIEEIGADQIMGFVPTVGWVAEHGETKEKGDHSEYRKYSIPGSCFMVGFPEIS